MNNQDQKYTGLLFILRKATIKISRGKEYPSLDVRNTNFERILNTARKENLCPMFVIFIKGKPYLMKIKPEYAQRTTISCKYSIPSTEKNLKMFAGHLLD